MNVMPLRPFQPEHGPTILAWVQSSDELRHWTARGDFPLTDPMVFSHWHADLDITPWELIVEGELVGYGELWCEPEEPWAELARLIIAPEHRNRGLGKQLVEELTKQVDERLFLDVWVRVFPTNEVARQCYAACGFESASEAGQTALNAGQPTAYLWMRRPL